MTKYAIILNGDAQAQQLQNVERASQSLSIDGYVTYVASPEKSLFADVYQDVSDPADFQKIVEQLGARITAEDELVIYATGSGTAEGLCVEGNCSGGEQLAQGLDALPYVHRTVIMGQGSGGSWQRFFADDLGTTFSSAGDLGEEVQEEKYAARLWENSLTITLVGGDLDRDGHISIEERLAYASKAVPSQDAPSQVKPQEVSRVREVATEEDLEAALKDAWRHGVRRAVIGFSAPWCGACHEFRPEFERQAAEAPDDVIFLWTENEELSENRNFMAFPTMVAVGSEGAWITIEDRSDLAGAAKASVTREVRKLTRAEEEKDLAALIRATSSGNLQVRLRAVQSCGQVAKEQGAEAVRDVLPVLIASLDDRDQQVREAAARAFLALGPDARAAIPALIVAECRYEELGSLAQSARERIGPASAEESAELIGLLWNGDPMIAEKAAQELGRMGPDAVGATGALTWVLQLNTRRRFGLGLRLDAIEALGKIGPGAAEALPLLIQALGDPSESIRSAAAKALGQIGPAAAPAIPALTALLHDPVEYVRSAAAESLEQVQ